jgi:cellulose synthase/poly-beta-1,6-N-acetylglucosamine synthase-like glycosyltransferase
MSELLGMHWLLIVSQISLYVLLFALLVPCVVLLVQALMALSGSEFESRYENEFAFEFGHRSGSTHLSLDQTRPITLRRPRIAVLIPAHNEEAGISATLDSVLPQLFADDRLLVIADNCSDATAQVARAAGALVFERFDLERRGKGYALDCGVQQLSADAPEVLIIVDADCIVAEGALELIARRAHLSGRPVQALYLMLAGVGASRVKKIAEFAWVVKNWVRPLGFHRLGLPCQLMGTGMAFPWATIRNASLANGHIVEDMKLGIELAKVGTPPLFCPKALVHSYFPSSSSGTQTQRTRWEHGHLSMIASEVPSMLGVALRKFDVRLLGLALDLLVPPVALLSLLVLIANVCAAVFAVITGNTHALGVALATLIMLACSILLSWWRYGRQIVSGRDLVGALWYMLAKLPIYLKFLVSRQVEWVRSKRDSE